MTKKNVKDTKDKNDILLKRIIISIILLIIFITAAFRLGSVGIVLNNLFRYLLGELYLFTVLSIVFLCVYFIFFDKKYTLSLKVIIGLILLNITIILLFAQIKANNQIGLDVFDAYFNMNPQIFAANNINYGGGIIGVFIYAGVSSLFGSIGTLVLIVAMFIISALLIVPLNVYKDLFYKAKETKNNYDIKREEKKSLKEIKEAKKETYIDVLEPKTSRQSDNQAFIDVKVDDKKEVKKDDEIIFNQNNVSNVEASSVETRTLKKSSNFNNYKFPPLNVFDEGASNKLSNINKSSAEVKGKKVIEILKNFGIEATLIATHIGPSVTKFELKPDSSVKVNKILNIADNIKMELAARDIRIEAPIPGRSAVGIEIPNIEPVPVRMRELIKGCPDKDSKLLFYLGKDLMGKVVTCQMEKMPHLLIAGATGSGKSVCINAIICSVLYRTNPSDVKLVLVDPKKVEFTPYHDIPHLLWPVITDATMASNMLKKVVVMMEERFDVFASFGARNIATYNAMVDDFNKKNTDPDKKMVRLPFIVVIIDELADLMMVAGKDVEASIQRITQLARAAGIHLIVATQRPSTDVITGIIKSNIPSRISFSVASSIDSRTILDQTGAERLLGNGDMLYFPQNEPSPIRLQGVFVDDKEVKAITSFTKSQAKPEYDDTYFEFLNLNKEGNTLGNSRSEKDSLYEEVKEYVIDVQKASTSLLQRRFSIGYNRAAGLIECLEENGIIGPTNGSKPREVYIKKEDSDKEE